MVVVKSQANKKFILFEKRFDRIEKDIEMLKSDVSVLKSDVSEIKVKLNGLVDNLAEWKSQMFNALDVFMIETKDQRDFRTIGSHQINTNTQRIEVLEKKVFGVVTQV